MYHMSPEELAEGYGWAYRRLFSHRSIWRRSPSDLGNLPSYLAGAYLYKKPNRFWHALIKHNLTGVVWRPLVELTRLRHLRFRRKLAADGPLIEKCGVSHVVGAGV